MDLVAKTRAFLESGTGFYSAPDASMLAPDFIFRGGVVGPPAAGRGGPRADGDGRLVFDDDGRVRHFATGLVVGKCEPARGDCNTSGLGAVLGLFHAVGFGWVGNLALISGFRKLANVLAASLDPSVPKTKSEADVVPAWWIGGMERTFNA
ncbi:hypothetical protein JL720_12751 [Aureococcus anophagefferens]|nr:hypothetical protein JL720_12751 [Aureococcus anophagefferens]